MEVQLVGLDDRQARRERQVVNEVKRLVARVQAEHEMGEAGDAGLFSLRPRDGTASVGHRVRVDDS